MSDYDGFCPCCGNIECDEAHDAERPVVDDAMVERAAEAWLVNTARKAGAHGVSFEQESMMRLGFEAGYKSALLDCSR